MIKCIWKWFIWFILNVVVVGTSLNMINEPDWVYFFSGILLLLLLVSINNTFFRWNFKLTSTKKEN